ncbi:MAG: hypothetical protein ABFD97_13465 [Syntrophobacter sp.]
MKTSRDESTDVRQWWWILTAFSHRAFAPSALQETNGTRVDTVFGVYRYMDLFAGLLGLAESHPEKFKEVMTEIADSLSMAAESTSHERHGSLLKYIAKDFRTAGESGDLSQILPPPASQPFFDAVERLEVNRFQELTSVGSALRIADEVFARNISGHWRP